MESSFGDWEAELWPMFGTTCAVLNGCDRLVEQRWESAIVATADQLRAASRDLHGWVQGHPCPHRDFDVVLERLGRSLEYTAATVEGMVKRGSVQWQVIDRERRTLYVAVTQLQMMMFEQSQREP